MHQTHGRTYTTSQLANAIGLQSSQPQQRLLTIARSCQLDDGPGCGQRRTWTLREVLTVAVAYALVHEAGSPVVGNPYKSAIPYARAVADACARGHRPAYLIMSNDDWLLIDNTPTADQHATDITLHLTRQGETVRVLHLRPILAALETDSP